MAQMEQILVLIKGEDQLSTPAASATRALQTLDKTAHGANAAVAAVGETAAKQTGLLGGFTSALGKIGVAGLGVGAVVGAVKGIGGALVGPISAASDLSESMSKVDVVFGDSAGGIQAWAKTTAQSLGQSRQEALEAAGGFGNLFVSMGLGQKPAADLSKRIVELGSDLASFNNIRPEDALEKLRAGLVGEAEPLRALGVNINEASVAQEAMRLGLAKTKDSVSDAAKIQARYSLIMQQTKTAQGDFARTSTGLANSQRIIAASFADLQTQIGERLLPVIAPLVSSFASALPRAMDALGPVLDRVGTLFGGVASGAGGLMTALQPLLSAGQTVVGFFTNAAGAGLKLHNALERLVGLPWANALVGAVELVRSRFADLGALLSGKMNIGDYITKGVAEAKTALGKIDLAAMLKDVGKLIGPALKTWTGAFLDWVEAMAPPFLKAMGEWADALGEWLIDQVPKIAKLLTEEWLPAFLDWAEETTRRLLPKLGDLFVAVTNWIADRAPGLAEKFLSEWVPSAIAWVVKAAIDILPKLAELVVAIGSWIVTDGAPALLKLSDKMGDAIVAGIVAGGKNLAEQLGPVLTAEIRKIKIDVGPFHLSAAGFSVDAPSIPGLGGGGSAPAAVKPGLGEGPPGGLGFQHGGSFYVGGRGGPDSQMVAFRASPGERVDVTPPGRRGAGPAAIVVNGPLVAVAEVRSREDADYLADVLPDALARALEKARSQQGSLQVSGLVRWA